MVKNKVAPPFKEAEFDIVYGRVSPRKVVSLMWLFHLILLKRVVHGIHMESRGLVRAEKMLKSFKG